MKALEILKRICNHGSATVIEIKESIEELEALENRKCDNCKTKNCSVKRILVEKDEINTDYFNCNDWESKCN